jgi:hypothetical protein
VIGRGELIPQPPYAAEPIRHGLRDRFAKSKAKSVDAWLEGRQPRTASQFVPIQALQRVLA